MRSYKLQFLLLLLFVPALLRAQVGNFFAEGDDLPRTFYGGLVGGFNFSQVDGDTYAGYHKVGLNAGGIVYARFSDHLGMSLELLYSRKGSRERDFNSDSYGNAYQNMYDIKLNYVEAPVMLRYFTNNKLHFGAGLSYGQLINSKETAVANFPINLDTSAYAFRKMEISYLVDVNYEFYKGWFLNFRYSRSITSVRDGDKIPVGFGGGIANGQYNNLFSLRLMYLIK